MKSKLFTLIVATVSCVLVSTQHSFASVIKYQGYSYSSGSNVVNGGNLDWLRWDLTNKQSVDAALNKYAIDGWRLASDLEISRLFNDFNLGETLDEDPSTNERHWHYLESGYQEYLNANTFISMFGFTAQSDTSPPKPHVKEDGSLTGYKEGTTFASARFDGGGFAELYIGWGIGWNWPLAPEMGYIQMDRITNQRTNLEGGVALVRSTVPESSSAILLLIALAGIAIRRKIKNI